MSKKCICGTVISEKEYYCTCCKAVVRHRDLPDHPSLNEHLVEAHGYDLLGDQDDKSSE